MAPPSPTSLYNQRKAKIHSANDTTSSNSLAFSSTISSLLTSSTPATRGRPRPSKAPKDDIFSSHNRNTKKRAAKDLEHDSDSEGRRARGGPKKDLGSVDDAILDRSRRKLEKKAKLYKEMKRRDYIPKEGEEELVDFDRKWVDRDAKGEVSSSDSEVDDGGEMVDYEDEYGRLRRGTKADAERMERRKLNKVLGQEELDRISARPAQPEKVIYGDTVQTLAFNPDEEIHEKMEALAGKRDRSMTPPEQRHYEADKEFRIRGVGFYNFSKDEEGRKREMEALEAERKETERLRKERDEKKDKRKKELEERRKAISEKRAKKQAESFLDNLGADLG